MNEQPEPRRIKRDQIAFFFDAFGEPVATVKPGERLILETEDAHCGHVRDASTIYASLGEMFERVGGVNPITGPLYVEGARARRDVVTVTINDVVPGPVQGQGYTLLSAGLGGLVSNYSLQEPLPPTMIICKIEDGMIKFPARGGHIDIPTQPFLGTIGVAPAAERRYTFYQGPDFMGNVDLPEVRAGSTIVLPVNVDGALVGLGDGHARQGHGEISGAAIECQTDTDVTIDVMTREEVGYVGLPQINTAEWIGSVAGFSGVNLGDVVRAGYIDLVKRLERQHGFSLAEAYLLTCQVAEVTIGQVVDPLYSALVRIDRRYIQ